MGVMASTSKSKPGARSASASETARCMLCGLHMKRVDLFFAPDCPFSVGTVTFMFMRGADVRLVNLDAHPEERARLEKQLGGRKLETPTLEVDGELHVAPPLSDLKKLLAQWGLPA